jgi:glycosyltransferase involved in cell wall biosynthesis
MKRPVVIVICNALDEGTRIFRGIHTDSPAASRKVFMLCDALRLAGVTPYVLSLGRGRANGSWVYFRASVNRVRGIPIVYSPFCHIPLLSELLSLIAPACAILRFASSRSKAVIFYNRLPFYLPAMFVSSAVGFKSFLDIEDGEIKRPVRPSLRRIINRIVRDVFDWLCRDGALLACRALATNTRIRPIHCYYGTAVQTSESNKPPKTQVVVLLSGTLIPETGCQILIDAIHTIRQDSETWAQQLCIEVCGMGTSLEAFSALAASEVLPKVTVHGRKTDAEYRELLGRCTVGLALKPNYGSLAATTFPSKVIEFASAGLLVITTDISDVREVLGENALYLTKNDPKELITLLRFVVESPIKASAYAKAGQKNILQRCSPHLAGHALAKFLFGSRT